MGKTTVRKTKPPVVAAKPSARAKAEEADVDEILESWEAPAADVVVQLAPPVEPVPEPKPATFDQLRKKKKPRTETVKVSLDQDATVVTLRLQALGSKSWEAMLADHPPTDQEQAEHLAEQEKVGVPLQSRRRLQWNLDTFPPALIAACSVEPKLTVAQVEELWTSESWNAGELDTVFSTAVHLCTSGASVQIGRPASLDEILARIRAAS